MLHPVCDFYEEPWAGYIGLTVQNKMALSINSVAYSSNTETGRLHRSDLLNNVTLD